MQIIREEHQRRSGANMFINGGVARSNHKNGGEKVRMRRLSKFTNPALIAATAAAVMFFSAATFAAGQEQDGLLLQGNGPGPAANEAGAGCNIIPPLASIGTKVSIKQFPPADSLTDAELAGPVQLLKSGKFDIPIEKLIKVNVPPGTPRGTITLPLFKGAVKTSSGLKPASMQATKKKRSAWALTSRRNCITLAMPHGPPRFATTGRSSSNPAL